LGATEYYSDDANGRLAQFTDRRGKVTVFQYDAQNRKTFAGFDYNGSGYESTISYQNDNGERLTQVVDSTAAVPILFSVFTFHWMQRSPRARRVFRILRDPLCASARTASDCGVAFNPLPRLEESAEHRVDACLVASAARLEPVENVAIKANVNILLGGRQSNHHRAFPARGQGTFIPVGEPFNFRLGHRASALPFCLALATGNFPPDLVSRKSRDIFVLPHLSPS